MYLFDSARYVCLMFIVTIYEYCCQVPVQRVTRYPLLLSRLVKVTPGGHSDKEALQEAQEKVVTEEGVKCRKINSHI